MDNILIKNQISSIDTLKIILTRRCNFRCRYCNLIKNKEKVDLKDLNDFFKFIDSDSRLNKIRIYGGEPLLEFDLLKKTIDLIRSKEKKIGKKLEISVATNGSLLSTDKLKFFKRNNVKLNISIDGNKSVQNRNRVFSDSKKSYNFLVTKIKMSFDTLEDYNISCLVTPDSESFGKLYDNFVFLHEKLGFKNIKIHTISYFDDCSKKEKLIFFRNIKSILNYIDINIKNGIFVFINNFNDILLKNMISINIASGNAFYRNLFSVNTNKSVGNLKNGINDDFFSGQNNNIDDLNKMYLKFLVKIIRKSKNDRNYRDYLDECKKRKF